MISQQGERILGWMYKNIKNAEQPQTIEKARDNINAMAKMNGFSDKLIIENIDLDMCRCRLVKTCDSLKDKYILYLHGGGYCMGSTEASLNLIGQIIDQSKCSVLSVDYRLAPENPFPTALDDAVSAYVWMLDNGISSEDIIIVGESAGGGLALSVMIELKNKLISLPKAAVLMSPWTDLTESGESYELCLDTDPYYNEDSIDNKTADMYAGGEDKHNPLISPLFADLSSLPEILIQVGTRDRLYNDSTRAQSSLLKYGVNVELKVYEDMWHVWHTFGERLPEAKQAVSEIGEFIRKKLNII